MQTVCAFACGILKPGPGKGKPPRVAQRRTPRSGLPGRAGQVQGIESEVAGPSGAGPRAPAPAALASGFAASLPALRGEPPGAPSTSLRPPRPPRLFGPRRIPSHLTWVEFQLLGSSAASDFLLCEITWLCAPASCRRRAWSRGSGDRGGRARVLPSQQLRSQPAPPSAALMKGLTLFQKRFYGLMASAGASLPECDGSGGQAFDRHRDPKHSCRWSLIKMPPAPHPPMKPKCTKHRLRGCPRRAAQSFGPQNAATSLLAAAAAVGGHSRGGPAPGRWPRGTRRPGE